MNYIRAKSSPFFGCTPEDIRSRLSGNPAPQALADALAAVSNHYFGILGDLDDVREDTQAGAWALWTLDAWETLYHELRGRICTQGTAYLPQLREFMSQYGYRDGCGWWIAE